MNCQISDSGLSDLVEIIQKKKLISVNHSSEFIPKKILTITLGFPYL